MKQLKINTKAQLLSMNIPVFISRIRPKDLQALPMIVIGNNKLSIQNDIPNGLGLAGPTDQSITVDIVISSTDNFSDLLDDAVDDCLRLLADPTYLQANWESLDSVDVSYNQISELEKPVVIASITLSGTGFKNYN